jgi:hypothetical protein
MAYRFITVSYRDYKLIGKLNSINLSTKKKCSLNFVHLFLSFKVYIA